MNGKVEAKKKWYENAAVMTLIGVLIGSVLSIFGNYFVAFVEQQYEVKNTNLEIKSNIYSEMIQSTYSLMAMNDGLIEPDLASFKEESYKIMAKARIYCDDDVVQLYNDFLSTFFTEREYDGDFVDNKLIPAIRVDLQVDD
ncbi:MAG: hypothetical protein GXY49_10750 [Syntrophomonadaceae bacterium]|nr:hypothetical protein [Syntrophomonadaceae bacterium]